MNILVVDDNPMNVMVVQEMLKRSGYDSVLSAGSAAEMFDLLRSPEHKSARLANQSSIDLILLDLMMPEIDGMEACRMLQRDERFRDIPIIIVTAIGDSRKLAEAMDLGATDYVTKPINKVELLARIRSALRLKKELDWHKERDKRMREELELARQVQHAVLPSAIAEDNYRIRAFFRSSEQLAGDLYAWHAFDRSRIIVAVIDAMGHGISSSLVSMFSASVLKEAMRTHVTPRRVMQELNSRLLQLDYENELVHYYCTGLCIWIDLEHGMLEYVNAGHPPGLLLRGRSGETIAMRSGSPPVGLFDGVELAAQTIALEPGDTIYLYTDGLLDLFPGDLEEQATALAGALRTARGEEARLERLLEQESFDRHADDRCLIRLEVRGKENGT
ncbi:PP2C family protein-serine/threonine phosphatase [Cohnella fermenti]|uniref:Fused response regulator/phosphatase n=1 Tax=Cohnella fermenti TaxID=2565925 RepID=A0A4S4BFJ0_9BACL|nr:fused response regulator/phosphatase [Cohnella fermenti]THF72843.1 fused response regulator/phosphatase [Cohnella fermenti]